MCLFKPRFRSVAVSTLGSERILSHYPSDPGSNPGETYAISFVS